VPKIERVKAGLSVSTSSIFVVLGRDL